MDSETSAAPATEPPGCGSADSVVFLPGAIVRAPAGADDSRQRIGVVRLREWHFKRGEYAYYLTCDGKQVSRRYFAGELEAVQSPAAGIG